MLYDNKVLKENFFNFLKAELAGKNLVLDIVQIGGDLASTRYIKIKRKIAQSLNIKTNLHHYQETEDYQTLAKKIEYLNKSSQGYILQLPVPARFTKLLDLIDYQKDLDLISSDAHYLWQKNYLPPTIQAIDLVLKNILTKDSDFPLILKSQLDLSSKTIAVIGQGTLVGRPLLRYLAGRNAAIISINKTTRDPVNLTRSADILITGAGSPELVTKDWLDPKAVVVDASTSEVNGHLVGDVKIDQIHDSNLLCASPGGIGRLTVLSLFWNLYTRVHSF